METLHNWVEIAHRQLNECPDELLEQVLDEVESGAVLCLTEGGIVARRRPTAFDPDICICEHDTLCDLVDGVKGDNDHTSFAESCRYLLREMEEHGNHEF